MESEDANNKKARGRGRGARARGRGRGRGGRGRGKKTTRIVSSDEEISQEQSEQEIPSTQVNIDTAETANNKENEVISANEEILVPPTIDMEADISQLEAPTFTTISRGPPEPMLRLKWAHKVSLIGEKVLNPMIHCCDQCEKPILVYGRMIPCKHIFCLKCARAEPIKICPRCKDKVVRVEQSGLGTVFMCTHGGSTYGNTGCRRTYLSQRDLQAHINHRHVTPQPISENPALKITQVIDSKTTSVPQRKSTEAPTLPTSSAVTTTRTQSRLSSSQQYSSSIPVVQPSSSRTNLINVPLQEAQQALGKVTLQQPVSINQTMHNHHVSEALAAAVYYSSSLQSTGTYSAPTVQTVMTQNYGTIPTISPQTVSQAAQISSRPSTVPPPPAPPQTPAYYAAYGQQYGQMPHYQYDQSSCNLPPYSPSNQNNQQWNQQQYYR